MRGCQKRVVFLKNTGSSIFESAYFVLKEDSVNKSDPFSYTDMVHEANRIIEENLAGKKRNKSIYIILIAAFLLGALFSFVTLYFINS